MLFRTVALLLAGSTLSVLTAQQSPPAYFSVPGPDAPELAPRGKYPVGVRTLAMVHPGQVDILHFDKTTGKAPLYDRPLELEIWYPATLTPGAKEATTYPEAVQIQGHTAILSLPGKALRDAPPLADASAKGGPFPLVIVSHGYPGSRTLLTYLTENLASKGYIVAAIDHTDSVVGAVKGFESTLLNRTQDQLFALDYLTAQAQQSEGFLHGILDSTRVAIVGYSMGGYGALGSAGAPYSEESAATKIVPGGYFSALTDHGAIFQLHHRQNLKAVVAIAPWGEQPPYNMWNAQGLAQIRIPSLFIVGDQDDVSGYEPGVKLAFERAVNSDRCMLVYENARHNVGGNPPPPGIPADFTGLEHYEEPAWRKDRITAINQHFITAFLDLYLKGDESRRAYLHLLVENSNDGKWPLAQGEEAGDAFSENRDPAQTYWKGFHRRWAVGLEMHCLAPLTAAAQPASPSAPTPAPLPKSPPQ